MFIYKKLRRYIRIKSRLYQLRYPNSTPAEFIVTGDDNPGIVIGG